MRPALAAIAVGSNLGERSTHIAWAWAMLARLQHARLLRCSSIIETAPWGPVPQGAYLNAACLLETTLPARELLHALHRLEHARGRVRDPSARFGPRTLDLDLVLFGDEVSSEADLVIPHPRMHERAFVLEPLAQIAPALGHPVLRRSVAELADALRSRREPRCHAP